MERQITLATETGIGGGSLSLFERKQQIDFREGAERIARSENLLADISELLKKNSLAKTDIKRLVVSPGPGSFTGIRTGISTIRGLQKALKCELFAVSALEALVLRTNQTGKIITGFASGKSEICWQIFESDGRNLIKPETSPQISNPEDFLQNLKNYPKTVLILYKDSYEKVFELMSETERREIKVLKADECAAKYMALRSFQTAPSMEFSPVYARDSKNA